MYSSKDFLIEFLANVFADDTSLYLAGSNLDHLLPLFKWCKFNRIDANWSKTFATIITNKRIQRPKSIILNNIAIQVV